MELLDISFVIGIPPMSVLRITCLVVMSWCVFLSSLQESAGLSVDDFVRIRCNGWNSTSWIWWEGSVSGVLPQQQSKTLFSIIGFNVARCVRGKDSNMYLLSREIQLMLDPVTRKKVSSWENPWTNERVDVVHVANDPVQQIFPSDFDAPSKKLNGERGVVFFDLPLLYPNPLASNTTLYRYSPYPLYQSEEYFKFFFSRQDLMRKPESVDDVEISWLRHSQWLPWMNMGMIPGQIIQSAQGIKVRSFFELPQILQDEVNVRMKLYEDAPICFLEGDNETSWTYFRDHYSEYVKNVEFPIPKETENRRCVPNLV